MGFFVWLEALDKNPRERGLTTNERRAGERRSALADECSERSNPYVPFKRKKPPEKGAFLCG